MSHAASFHRTYVLPTLVVDADSTQANQFAERLRGSGYEIDVATSCRDARKAVLARAYGTLVVVADLGLVTDLDCLVGLRRMARRTWIIVISSALDASDVAFQHGADSLLVAPFDIGELVFRLSAFAHRSRPM